MDGFKLLEHIGLELDLPVISAHPFAHIDGLEYRPRCHACRQLEPAYGGCMNACGLAWQCQACSSCTAVMSANGETSTVLRGVTHGAVDFLIKPVRIEELRNVWQHVVRRRRTGSVRRIVRFLWLCSLKVASATSVRRRWENMCVSATAGLSATQSMIYACVPQACPDASGRVTRLTATPNLRLT